MAGPGPCPWMTWGLVFMHADEHMWGHTDSHVTYCCELMSCRLAEDGGLWPWTCVCAVGWKTGWKTHRVEDTQLCIREWGQEQVEKNSWEKSNGSSWGTAGRPRMLWTGGGCVRQEGHDRRPGCRQGQCPLWGVCCSVEEVCTANEITVSTAGVTSPLVKCL